MKRKSGKAKDQKIPPGVRRVIKKVAEEMRQERENPTPEFLAAPRDAEEELKDIIDIPGYIH